MDKCEIVDSTACGNSFKYCRTHKTEPQDCPSAKREEKLDGINPFVGVDFGFEIAPRFQAPVSNQRFKIGDKVKRINDSTRTLPVGTVATIVKIEPLTGDLVLDLCTWISFHPHNFEAVE